MQGMSRNQENSDRFCMVNDARKYKGDAEVANKIVMSVINRGRLGRMMSNRPMKCW